ncbi:hypothetical protein GCM10011348_15390 [Marinobacterium nitratireducens]|uniref:Rieske domain-containing protein n=1 Tax=Marinobacterium nitratireducens TaxID=518897 RepID=A0A918DRU8_9GAMM|nr:Rieske 2Fe-2S domain-containing protein [Marinobacterium nitratireducens]GGO79905.1 hypothetical protein GCM10011348_15390 [Marinobacterium nitratireducens]
MKKWYDERYAPEAGAVLCDTNDVSVGKARLFSFGEEAKFKFRMILYNDQGVYRAYRNVCPHFQVPLGLEASNLFTTDKRQFMCTIHYAKFEFADGACTEGPCEGLRLEAIPVETHDGQVYIARME